MDDTRGWCRWTLTWSMTTSGSFDDDMPNHTPNQNQGLRYEEVHRRRNRGAGGVWTVTWGCRGGRRLKTSDHFFRRPESPLPGPTSTLLDPVPPRADTRDHYPSVQVPGSIPERLRGTRRPTTLHTRWTPTDTHTHVSGTGCSSHRFRFMECPTALPGAHPAT